MQDAELAERRKRCYDLVVQLDELEGRQNEQEEHLQRVKRQRTHLHEEFEHEKRSFVEEWTKANAGRDDGAASRDEEAARAEREWNDWVNKAKLLQHGSSTLSATSDSHDIATAAPSSSDDTMVVAAAAEAAVVETIEGDGIPVPQLQERVPAAEPPRLRSTRRSRRSFSLTSPTAPSTPVRKRLEWDAAHNADSTDGSAELMPSPGSGLPSSASSSPATSSPATTTVGEDSSASTAAMCKLPTPVRGRSTSPTAAAAAAGDQPTPAAAVAVAAPSRKELIDELLNPPSSSSEAAPPSPTPQIVVSTPSSSQNSARVLFEE